MNKFLGIIRKAAWLWILGLIFLGIIYILVIPISIEDLFSSQKVLFGYALAYFIGVVILCLFFRRIMVFFTKSKFWTTIFPISIILASSIIIGGLFYFLNRFYLEISAYVSLLQIFPLSF